MKGKQVYVVSYNAGVMEHQIWKSEMAELMNTQRPSAERRRRDLEEAIGTFEDCMIEAMYGHN